MLHIAPVLLPSVMRILHSFINERHIVFPQPCAAYNKDENCVANGWGKDKFGEDGRYLVTISDRSVKVWQPWTIRYASILKEIDYPLVGRNECQVLKTLTAASSLNYKTHCGFRQTILNTLFYEKKMLRTTCLGRFFELDKSFICAGGIEVRHHHHQSFIEYWINLYLSKTGRDLINIKIMTSANNGSQGVGMCKGDGGSPLICKTHGTNSWVQVSTTVIAHTINPARWSKEEICREQGRKVHQQCERTASNSLVPKQVDLGTHISNWIPEGIGNSITDAPYHTRTLSSWSKRDPSLSKETSSKRHLLVATPWIETLTDKSKT